MLLKLSDQHRPLGRESWAFIETPEPTHSLLIQGNGVLNNPAKKDRTQNKHPASTIWLQMDVCSSLTQRLGVRWGKSKAVFSWSYPTDKKTWVQDSTCRHQAHPKISSPQQTNLDCSRNHSERSDEKRRQNLPPSLVITIPQLWVSGLSKLSLPALFPLKLLPSLCLQNYKLPLSLASSGYNNTNGLSPQFLGTWKVWLHSPRILFANGIAWGQEEEKEFSVLLWWKSNRTLLPNPDSAWKSLIGSCRDRKVSHSPTSWEQQERKGMSLTHA